MNERCRRVTALFSVVLGLATASCDGGNAPPSLSPDTVYFAEQIGLAVTVETVGGTSQAVESVASPVIANLSDSPFTIVAIDGYDVDPGVRVRYVGTCSRGCIGAAKANEPDVISALNHFIEHTLPVAIPAQAGIHGSGMRMTFRVDVDQTGIARIASGTGCLWVRAVRVSLSDGRHLRITGPSGHVVMALFLDAPGLASGDQRCPLGGSGA